jgi:hypothetical protein
MDRKQDERLKELLKLERLNKGEQSELEHLQRVKEKYGPYKAAPQNEKKV